MENILIYLDYLWGLLQRNAGGIFAFVTFVLTFGALIAAIYQSILSRRALDAARTSIDQDKRARQMAALPDMDSVIQVQVHIDMWLKDLVALKQNVENATREKDEEALKSAVRRIPDSPEKLSINRFLVENMPESLTQILLSGAQYYYNAAAPSPYLVRDGVPDWKYAVSIHDRYDDSIAALQELKSLIADMIPDVLMETPASISSSKFISK